MHHVSSPTFAKISDTNNARYLIGLSGTIERKDGKHVVFFKQKTAYEFSECDWSSDVCSSDLKQKTAYEISELQSHSEISYAVFCLKKKKDTTELKKATETCYPVSNMKN